MDVHARIVQLKFEPHSYFEVSGMLNSTHNENRCHGGGTLSDAFTMRWFWFDSSTPPEIIKVFKKVIAAVDEDLQQKGVIPKRWPGVLHDPDSSADVFEFTPLEYCFSNPRWLSSKERDDTVTVTASSKWFTDGTGIEKRISLHLDEAVLTELFSVLDKNL